MRELLHIIQQPKIMHIITKKRLDEFWVVHPESKQALTNWFKAAKKAEWKSLADTKLDFSHAELVGKCIVFNLGGNNYRLIVKIKFRSRVIFVRFVLTHAQYSRNRWKTDCI